MSFLFVRSPEAPKMTRTHESPVGSGSCDNFSKGLAWIIADISVLFIDALGMDFESKRETNLLQRVRLCIFGCSLAGALSHMNDNSTFFEAHFIHQRFHGVAPTTMNRSGIFGSSRIRYLIQVKSSPFVLHRDCDFIRFTTATNINLLW